jgi:beta-glucosidase
LDPIFFGEYPKEMREMLSSNLPAFTPTEKRFLQNKVDFIGVNHYTAIYTRIASLLHVTLILTREML